MPTSGWRDKQITVYPCSGVLLSNIKKQTTTDSCYNMDESQNYYAEWKKPDNVWLVTFKLKLSKVK